MSDYILTRKVDRAFKLPHGITGTLTRQAYKYESPRYSIKYNDKNGKSYNETLGFSHMRCLIRLLGLTWRDMGSKPAGAHGNRISHMLNGEERLKMHKDLAIYQKKRYEQALLANDKKKNFARNCY